MKKKVTISLFTLVMFITGSIDSIRNLPATALFGTNLVFFFMLGAIFFLAPAAMVAAKLSVTTKQHHGIFGWANQAFGEQVGFLAIWLQWINTIVWYPTILSFIAANIAFLISPSLAANKYYLISIILSIYWGLTAVNLRGFTTSARFASIFVLLGMVIPMLMIFSFALFWLFSSAPSQLHFNLHNIMPDFNHLNNWVSLTAIMTSFLGLEMATVHVNDVTNPRRNFPKAMFYSAMFILVTMLFGSLAIAMIIPENQIGLVDGVMQEFYFFFEQNHILFLMPVVAFMLTVGSIGEMINWMVSPAKGLLYAAELGYLPKFLAKKNNYNVAYRILIMQAMLVTVVCFTFLYMPTVNSSYWLLTDLSTELYMLMYVIMFASAIMIGMRKPELKTKIWSIFGLIGCLITLIIGFFPPASLNIDSNLRYTAIFASSIVILLIPAVLLILLHFFYKAR